MKPEKIKKLKRLTRLKMDVIVISAELISEWYLCMFIYIVHLIMRDGKFDVSAVPFWAAKVSELFFIPLLMLLLYALHSLLVARTYSNKE